MISPTPKLINTVNSPSHDTLSVEFQIACTCSESGQLDLIGLFIYWSKAQIQPLYCTGVSHSTHRLFELTLN